MPQIMRSIAEIMVERKRDTLLIDFPGLHSFDFDKDARSRALATRLRHFEWFEAHGSRDPEGNVIFLARRNPNA